MDSALYVATAAQKSLLRQLDVVANNVANANSVGFRAEKVDFASIVSTGTADNTHFPTINGVRFSTESGTQVATGNPLDLAITGEGFFAVETPSGAAYTRDGRLTLTPFGELTSVEGYPILDAGGAPIVLDANAGNPLIHGDGRIEQGGRLVGNIGVFALTEENVASRLHNTAFLAKVPPEPVALGGNISISQGNLENSNVSPMQELANLISLTRAFESAAKIVEQADATMKEANSQLSGT